MRVAHTHPVLCAADCPAVLIRGLLMCPDYWARVSDATRERFFAALYAWTVGASVANYKAARKQVIREASMRRAA